MKNKWKISAGLTLVLSLSMLLVALLMGACPGSIETAAGGSVPMKCHWTIRVCVMLSAASAIFSVIQFLLKEKTARLLSEISIVAFTVCQLLTSSSKIIGTCAKEGMQCRETVSVLRILWLVILVVELVTILFELRKQHPSKMS